MQIEEEEKKVEIMKSHDEVSSEESKLFRRFSAPMKVSDNTIVHHLFLGRLFKVL